MRSHESRAERRITSWPPLDAVQDAIGFLGCRCTLTSRVQFFSEFFVVQI